MPTFQQVTKAFVVKRDEKRAMAKRHKEEIAPLNDELKLMEAFLLRELQKEGAQHIATEDATVYQSSRSTVKMKDWEGFMNWVKDTDSWHMLTRKAADAAVKDYLEEEGKLPDGLDISTEKTVGVTAR